MFVLQTPPDRTLTPGSGAVPRRGLPGGNHLFLRYLFPISAVAHIRHVRFRTCSPLGSEYKKKRLQAGSAEETILTLPPSLTRARPETAAVTSSLPTPRQNQILAALPVEEYERLLPSLELVQLPLGEVLHEPGVELDKLYFPISS